MQATLLQLWQHEPVIVIHAASATLALLLGSFILLRRKGTFGHRSWGWAWVVLMGTAAGTSVFVGSTLPNLYGVSPIHALTVLVLFGLPRAIWHVRNGRVQGHRQWMRGMFIGGCVVAGLFTLMPDRMLGKLLWQQGLGLLS